MNDSIFFLELLTMVKAFCCADIPCPTDVRQAGVIVQLEPQMNKVNAVDVILCRVDSFGQPGLQQISDMLMSVYILRSA